MSTTAISALVAAIPDEEDACFVAQVGDRGRITSRAGSVEAGPEVLTAVAIDSLNATIFPPDRLRTLQQTGGVTFYFSVPGVDSWFSAVAGSHETDRWLEVRRRKTAAPLRVQPAVEPAAVPQAVPAAPATPPSDGFDDLADFASFEFPSKHIDVDSEALSLPDDLFEELAGAGRVDPKDRRSWETNRWYPPLDSRRARAILCPPARTRKWVQVGIAVVACAAALLGMSYGGASQPSPAAAQTASSPSLPATFKSTPPRASVTPPATPAAAVTPPAQPAAPSAETTAPPTPATTSPVWTTGAPAETIRPAEQRRNGFSVQVAAVETRAEADRLVTRFVTQGYSAYVARGEGAAANYYRVRIGAFADRKAAEDVARQLASTEGAKPWIAKEESSSRR